MTSRDRYQSQSSRKRISRAIQYTILVLVMIGILVPIVILIFGGLKTRGEMYSRPYTIPNPPHFENYTRIFSQKSFWTAA